MLQKIRTADDNFILPFEPFEVGKAWGIISQLAKTQYPSQIIINEKGVLTIYIQGDPELDWRGLGIEVKYVTELFNVPSGGQLPAANKANE